MRGRSCCFWAHAPLVAPERLVYSAARPARNKMSIDLSQQLERVRERIAQACQRSGRDPSAVQILAVTKTQPMEVLQAALRLGLHDLGENRVQEALPKIEALASTARVHLIGQLQTNKVNKVVGAFASIQTVDRSELLDRISRRAIKIECTQEIWIQVDISQEEQKGGCPPEMVVDLWEQGLSAGGIHPKGLMGMVRLQDDESAARARFARLREHAAPLRDSDGAPALLSMGMSRDFEWAVEEGSNQLRLGSVLFGPRRSR